MYKELMKKVKNELQIKQKKTKIYIYIYKRRKMWTRIIRKMRRMKNSLKKKKMQYSVSNRYYTIKPLFF